MRLYDILSQESQRELRDQRAEAYLDEAEAFLAFAYDEDTCLDTPRLRRDFARGCLERSRALGIMRRREHLRYLSQCVLCGIAFERNPLYRHELKRAGWLDHRGIPTRAPDTDAFTSFANRWSAMAALECAAPDVALSACLDAIERGQPLDIAQVVAILREAWPDRSAVVPAPALENFAEHVLQNVKRQNMPGDVSVIFAVLSLHLGAYFFHDARYIALSRAFVNKGEGDAARSIAAAETIRRIWAPDRPASVPLVPKAEQRPEQREDSRG